MGHSLGCRERSGADIPKFVGDGFPMDGTSVWPRTSPGGTPARFVTRNTGRIWERQDSGLPLSQALVTVKHKAMSSGAHQPVGRYFGPTSGEIRAGRNERAKWTCIARHLPHIYAIEAAELA